MEVINRTIQVAKKEHKCNFCNGIIPIGEKYERQAIKGDGFYIWKSHLRCLEIVSKLDMYDNCDEGVTDEDFREYITEKYIELRCNQEIYPALKFSEMLDYVCNHYNI